MVAVRFTAEELAALDSLLGEGQNRSAFVRRLVAEMVRTATEPRSDG